MSTVILQLTTATERKLREQAGRAGLTLEAYLTRLAEQSAGNGPQPISGYPFSTGVGGPTNPDETTLPKFISRPLLTDAQFRQRLSELAAGLTVPHLPADFSRADLYEDHD